MAWKRKAGGGFLNGVGGVITSFGFDSTTFEGGRNGSYDKLSAVLKIQPDGGEEIEQYLDAGFMPDDGGLSKDKKTLETELEGPLRDDTEFIRFVDSAVEAGFPETDLEVGQGKNFDCLVGRRFVFKREPDREQQIRVGRSRLDKKRNGAGAKATDDEAFEAGKREAKDGPHKGKKFNLDVLLVDAYVGEEKVSKGRKETGGKTAKATASPANETDIDLDRADEVMTLILEDAKGGTLKKGSVSGAVIRYQTRNSKLMTKEERTAIKDFLVTDDYLEGAVERGVIDYDDDAGVISSPGGDEEE